MTDYPYGVQIDEGSDLLYGHRSWRATQRLGGQKIAAVQTLPANFLRDIDQSALPAAVEFVKLCLLDALSPWKRPDPNPFPTIRLWGRP